MIVDHRTPHKQEKPMSTSSTIADSSAPSANHTIIRVGLIGVGNWALNGPVRVLSLMPQYEMAAVYSQRRDAAQYAQRSLRGRPCTASGP